MTVPLSRLHGVLGDGDHLAGQYTVKPACKNIFSVVRVCNRAALLFALEMTVPDKLLFYLHTANCVYIAQCGSGISNYTVHSFRNIESILCYLWLLTLRCSSVAFIINLLCSDMTQ